MSRHRIHLIAAVLAAASAATVCSRDRARVDESISAALRVAADARRPAFTARDGERGHRVWQEAQRVYRQNGYQLAWGDGRRMRGTFDALRLALHAGDREGLDPADYHVADLDAAPRSGLAREQAIDVDVHATYAYLRYAWDLTHGMVDPEDIDPQWHSARREVDLHEALLAALDDGGIEKSLAALAPRSAQYQALKHQLARARDRGDAAAALRIAMNMDRWRWLPDTLGARYIFVNIPAYHLDAVENGRSVLGMKVVTGKKSSPTPILADEMTSVVFSPYWNIPQDIVEKEIKPKLERDPDYLEKNNIETDEESGRFRQRPGKGNSLGGVKFLFPNHFNVYLHDTPAQALFDRVERDFSHGCVRLDDPHALAQYVLRDRPEWTADKIAAAMTSGTEKTVKLEAPLPIYLVYFTVWDDNGELKTAPDVYGLDRKHESIADKAS
jgi:murein L,D-transpeptidase YcbB/YkuD